MQYIMFFANDVAPLRQPVTFHAPNDLSATTHARNLGAERVYVLGQKVADNLQKK